MGFGKFYFNSKRKVSTLKKYSYPTQNIFFYFFQWKLILRIPPTTKNGDLDKERE